MSIQLISVSMRSAPNGYKAFMALPAFRPCPCGFQSLERAERALWMRLALPERRLYVCSQCRTLQFLPKRHVESEQAAARQRQPFAQWTPPAAPTPDTR